MRLMCDTQLQRTNSNTLLVLHHCLHMSLERSSSLMKKAGLGALETCTLPLPFPWLCSNL